MYRYDEIDREVLADRVAEFREQCDRRLSGAMTEDQFKPLRLMNGLYLQLHAYMLRVAIPYGALNSAQLRVLANIARTYDRGYGHFTTRTNIQFHWIKLRDAPDILRDLAEVGLHAIQTSGNCIRNLTADPHAGATADEVDPTVVDVPPGIQLPAAQVQDRRHGGGQGPGGDQDLRRGPAPAS
jgi:sulfite reductase (NADPH) hemoprotein beta-component